MAREFSLIHAGMMDGASCSVLEQQPPVVPGVPRADADGVVGRGDGWGDEDALLEAVEVWLAEQFDAQVVGLPSEEDDRGARFVSEPPAGAQEVRRRELVMEVSDALAQRGDQCVTVVLEHCDGGGGGLCDERGLRCSEAEARPGKALVVDDVVPADVEAGNGSERVTEVGGCELDV